MHRPVPARGGRGEEVVRLVAGRLRRREAERRDERRQRVELLEQRVVELAPGLVAGQRLVPVGRHVERVPADDHRRRAARPPRAAAGSWRSRRARSPAARRRRESTSAARGRRGARASRRRSTSRVLRRGDDPVCRTCHAGEYRGSRRCGYRGAAEMARNEAIRRAPTRDRRVARQGEDHRRLPRRRTTSSSRRSATSATFRTAPPRCRPSRRRSRGRGSASTSTPISSRSTSSTRRRRRSSRACARSSRTPTSSCSRRTKTARARRSPGTSSRC